MKRHEVAVFVNFAYIVFAVRSSINLATFSFLEGINSSPDGAETS